MTLGVIDLHTHTHHSDGSATSAELVELACDAGARAIAITDHDTTSGLEDGRTAAARRGIQFVNGIEISAEFQPGTMHILGYFIDHWCVPLQSALDDLRQARKDRNPRIARRLQALGIDINYDEVAALAGNDVVGRPHFAAILVEKGHASSVKDAFDKYLAKGRPAYVEKRRLSPQESIGLIHEAGGVASLAHPYQLGLAEEELEDEVKRLASLGLDAIEAIYSRHSPQAREEYAKLAARHALLVTGGSDFHGTYKPDISVVTGLGDLRVPYDILSPLEELSRTRARHDRKAPGA